MDDLAIKEEYECAGGSITLRLYYDQDVGSPRKEWDNFGTLVCWHRNYLLGDENICRDSAQQHYDDLPKGSVVVPVYLLDHSGLRMNTGGFGCPWDSGQVGFIYATPETIRKEMCVKKITAKIRQKVFEILKGEIECMDQYLSGDVYGYVITWEDEAGTPVDEDSCWGFYGYDYALEEARSVVRYMQGQAAEIAPFNCAI